MIIYYHSISCVCLSCLNMDQLVDQDVREGARVMIKFRREGP